MFACKMFLTVTITIPKDSVYGELGLYPLHVLSMMRGVRYWFRLLGQPGDFHSEKIRLTYCL